MLPARTTTVSRHCTLRVPAATVVRQAVAAVLALSPDRNQHSIAQELPQCCWIQRAVQWILVTTKVYTTFCLAWDSWMDRVTDRVLAGRTPLFYAVRTQLVTTARLNEIAPEAAKGAKITVSSARDVYPNIGFLDVVDKLESRADCKEFLAKVDAVRFRHTEGVGVSLHTDELVLCASWCRCYSPKEPTRSLKTSVKPKCTPHELNSCGANEARFERAPHTLMLPHYFAQVHDRVQ